MPLKYSVIEIYSNEEARCKGKPLSDTVVQYIRGLKTASRCIVTRGVEGCYENGEVATQNILALSFNMPLKIEIVLPSSELDRVLPMLEEMVCEGIVAVRTIETCSHKTRKRLLPRQVKVRDLMTPSPEKVGTSTPLSEVTRLLLSSKFNGVPVVDDNDRLLGIITQEDLIYRADLPMRLGLLATSDQEKVDIVLDGLATIKAEEIMTHPVVSIKENETATEAVNLMIQKELKRLPVLSERGKLVGVLSRVDIFSAIMTESPDWRAFQKRSIKVGNMHHVSDIMRRDTHAVSPETSVEEVIRIIDSDDIQRVAVLDEDGVFLGLISDRDLLAAFSDHHTGIWDYFARIISFTERGRRQKEVREHLREKTAGEVMKTDIATVGENTTLGEAIKLMTEKALKRVPVIDEKGKFKGMISRDELLRIGFGRS